MARHIHLDPVGGIAGDMFVSAMLDAFPESVDACWQDLQVSGVLQHVEVTLLPMQAKGLAAKQLVVAMKQHPPQRTGQYSDLRSWLEHCKLADFVKQRSLSILHLLAEAEASVHGVDINDVHFHEVADWDSLVDVVAAASVIERNSVSSWSCGALPLGAGLVKTEHGFLPVPAPATAFLLKGLAVQDDGETGERVTPTGAAIVRSVLSDAAKYATDFSRRPDGVLVSMGSGAGTRQLLHRPNILRVAVIEDNQVPGQRSNDRDEVIEISFDIDDMTPEELAVSLDYIRQSAGVLDAGMQFGIGKKGRACFHVVVLSTPQAEAQVCDCCFRETTTLGMRIQGVGRRVLPRESHQVSDNAGSASVKVARRLNSATAKIESDDLATLPGLQARRLRAQQLVRRFQE